jgi:hypothetical protein
MLRVIPIKQQILVTNNNTPNTIYPHPTYMGPLGTENNGATVLAVIRPRVR